MAIQINKKLNIFFLIALFFIGSAQVSFGATINKPTNYLGMIGYWTFDGKDMTPNVRDSSGQGNHAFLTNFTSTTTASGKIGQALYFDGSNDYVDIPDMIEGLDQITVSAWVRINDFSGNQRVIIEQSGASTDPIIIDFANGTGGNDLKFRCAIVTTSGLVNSGNSSQYRDRNWHHVACVYNGSTVTIFVDGNPFTSSPQTGNLIDSTNNLVIGTDGAGETWNGAIDDFRIYNRALSNSELLKLFNTGTTRSGKSTNTISNLIGHWTFDGAHSSTTITDISGQGVNGYFLGGATSSAKTIGKIGQALRLDGIDDCVTFGDVNAYDFGATDSFSVSWWYKSTAGNNPIITKKQGSGNTLSGFYFQITSGSGGTVDVRISDGTNQANILDGSFDVNNNVWRHIVAVIDRDTNTMKIYVDSVAGADSPDISSVGSLANSVVFDIGARGSGTCSSFINATIDDTRIYSKALSEKEVKQIFNEAQPKINKSPTGKNSTGLVGHWTFDGKDMTPNVRDVSGSGNHGNLSGQTSTTTAIGKIGQALQFDGVDDSISFGDLTATENTSTLTVSAWVKFPSSDSAGSQFIVAKDRSGFTSWSLVRNSSEALGVTIHNGTASVSAQSQAAALRNSSWNHVVGVYDGNNITAYVNGIAGTPVAQTGNIRDRVEPVCIASRSTGTTCNGNYTNLVVDDVRIYNRSFSATEVRQLYNIGR